MLLKILFCVFLQTVLITATGFESLEDVTTIETAQDAWCYQDEKCGEATWKDNCQGKDSQHSPVNIVPANITGHLSLTTFTKDTHKIPGFTIAYKGHGIVVQPVFTSISFFWHQTCGDNAMKNLHFHWGNMDDVGSEHTINQRSFPMEIHIVYVCDQYNNFDAASKSSDVKSSLTIVVLVEIEHDEGAAETKTFLDPIISRIAGIMPADTNIDHVDLTGLFESKKAYLYRGSYTSPPCSPTTWMIMQRPLVVPKRYLEVLRKSAGGENSLPGNNFRALKPQRPNNKPELVSIDY